MSPIPIEEIEREARRRFRRMGDFNFQETMRILRESQATRLKNPKPLIDKHTSIRFIEDSRDLHADKEIWIICPGPSLNEFPDGFFLNKITIALNWTIMDFPESTYWLCSHPDPVFYMRDYDPKVFCKSIFTHPLVPVGPRHPISKEQSLDILREFRFEPIRFLWHPICGNTRRFRSLLKSTVSAIMAKKATPLLCMRTILHYAIQCAVIFGSKRVMLAGCDNLFCPKGRAQGRKLTFFYGQRAGLRGRGFEMGTQGLISAFKPYRIEIIKYYYKEKE